MLDLIGLSALLDAAYAAAALAALFLGLRWLDRRIAAARWPLFDKVKENAIGCAIYLGARWVGACLVVAALVR